MAAYGVGLARGAPIGLETARQRRLEEEDRQVAAEERRRRREREDWAFDRAKQVAPDEDRMRNLQIQGAELGLETSRFNLGRAHQQAKQEDWRFQRERDIAPDEDRMRNLQIQSAELGLEDARFASGRTRVAAEREDQDRAAQEAQAAAAAFPALFEGLARGIDPQLLLRRYNDQSPRKLAAIDYDLKSGMVRLTDDEGESVAHPLEQWRQAYPMKREPLKLGKDDRLIDPVTGEELVGPSSGAGDEATTGGRKLSTFNPESFAKDVSVKIAEVHGGQLGLLGEITGIQDPEARQLALYQQALGEDIAGRYRDAAASGALPAAEIANAVVEATKGVQSDLELEKRAEEWRTRGRNKTLEQAQAWMEAERNRQRMQAQARLERAVQRILERSSVEKPDWAGEEVPAEVLGDAQLDPGQEYGFQLPDGRETTIRVAPNGKVYEVGKTQERTTPEREPESSPAPASTAAPPVESAAPPVESAAPAVEPAAAPQEPSAVPPESPSAENVARYGAGRPGLRDELELVSDLVRAKPWIRAQAERERRGLPSMASLREERGRQRVAERVRAAIGAGETPKGSDLRILSELDDMQLAALGLSAEEIAVVREQSAVESALSRARAASEFSY